MPPTTTSIWKMSSIELADVSIPLVAWAVTIDEMIVGSNARKITSRTTLPTIAWFCLSNKGLLCKPATGAYRYTESPTTNIATIAIAIHSPIRSRTVFIITLLLVSSVSCVTVNV